MSITVRPADLAANANQIGAPTSYGLTPSPVNFLSHATPAEVLVDEDAVSEIRRRRGGPALLFP